MLDRAVLSLSKPLIDRIAARLLAAGVKADHLTWAGFAVGMTALPLIAFGFPALAILAVLANRLFDALDGAVARLAGATDRGAFLDFSLDFLFYSSIPLGFALSDPAGHALAAAILIYAFVGTGSSFLAFAVLAERRKLKSADYPTKGIHYLGGLTEATETVIAFVLMCLFPAFFPVIAIAFAALCLLTIVSRIAAGIALFRD